MEKEKVLALLVIFNEISIRSNHKEETYTVKNGTDMGAIQQTGAILATSNKIQET
jgi:hypothetical protein